VYRKNGCKILGSYSHFGVEALEQLAIMNFMPKHRFGIRLAVQMSLAAGKSVDRNEVIFIEDK
jgi:hypothetical protein